MSRLISRRRNARWDQNDHALLWLMIPHVAFHNVLQANRPISLFISEKITSAAWVQVKLTLGYPPREASSVTEGNRLENTNPFLIASRDNRFV